MEHGDIVYGMLAVEVTKAALAACDQALIIPMARGVDSLNVAASSAVAFWQLFRPCPVWGRW